MTLSLCAMTEFTVTYQRNPGFSSSTNGSFYSIGHIKKIFKKMRWRDHRWMFDFELHTCPSTQTSVRVAFDGRSRFVLPWFSSSAEQTCCSLSREKERGTNSGQGYSWSGFCFHGWHTRDNMMLLAQPPWSYRSCKTFPLLLDSAD